MKKINVYIPEEIKRDMDRLAKARDRSISNLVASVFREEIKQAIASGELEPLEPEAETLNQEAAQVMLVLVAKLIDGEELTQEEEAQLAQACDRPPNSVHAVSQKIQNS